MLLSGVQHSDSTKLCYNMPTTSVALSPYNTITVTTGYILHAVPCIKMMN